MGSAGVGVPAVTQGCNGVCTGVWVDICVYAWMLWV
jgi:hypothetical protein